MVWLFELSVMIGCFFYLFRCLMMECAEFNVYSRS